MRLNRLNFVANPLFNSCIGVVVGGQTFHMDHKMRKKNPHLLIPMKKLVHEKLVKKDIAGVQVAWVESYVKMISVMK